VEVVNVFERKLKISIRRAKKLLNTVDGNALITQGSASGELRQFGREEVSGPSAPRL
jgi:hypothetical protein